MKVLFSTIMAVSLVGCWIWQWQMKFGFRKNVLKEVCLTKSQKHERLLKEEHEGKQNLK